MGLGFSNLKREGAFNPVTHVLKAIAVFKRFGRGCKSPTGIGVVFAP
jgi:hypothetical protein